MSTQVDFVVVGVTPEDWEEEYASAYDKGEAYHYATQLANDYPKVRIYKVTRELLSEIDTE